MYAEMHWAMSIVHMLFRLIQSEILEFNWLIFGNLYKRFFMRNTANMGLSPWCRIAGWHLDMVGPRPAAQQISRARTPIMRLAPGHWGGPVAVQGPYLQARAHMCACA